MPYLQELTLHLCESAHLDVVRTWKFKTWSADSSWTVIIAIYGNTKFVQIQTRSQTTLLSTPIVESTPVKDFSKLSAER